MLFINIMQKKCFALFLLMFFGVNASAQNAGSDELSLSMFYSVPPEGMEVTYSDLYEGMENDVDKFNSSPLPFTPNLFQAMICLYQRRGTSRYSAVRCQFTPSCSRYAYMAINGLGTIQGVTLALDRYWRCNANAFGTYPLHNGYLFDPPIKQNDVEKPLRDTIGDVRLKDTSYLAWLVHRQEWERAYNVCLEKEFETPDATNRIALAKLSLNREQPEKALLWLTDNRSESAAQLRAIAYYRSKRYYNAMRELSSQYSDSLSLNYRAASLWLSAFLQTPVKSESLFLQKALQSLEQYRGNMNITTESMDLISSSGSPTISLALSVVVPGLGQASNGFIEDGIYALLFVGGFAYLTARNIAAERYAESVAFGLGFTLAYSANLVAAYHSPER
ncbi:MAG: membrane protein insertion efficiency factor YidD, partial [Bacteroidetes bacterium]